MKKPHFLYEYVEKIFIFKFIILRWKNIEVFFFAAVSFSHFHISVMVCFPWSCHSIENHNQIQNMKCVFSLFLFRYVCVHLF